MKERCANLEQIQRLVGDIRESDLRNVDCYVGDNLGIFIPSVGYCGYAVKPRHVHPSYSFTVFFSKEQSLVPVQIAVPDDHYLAAFISPGVPHEEEETGAFIRYIAIFIAKDYFERQFSSYGRQPSGNDCWKQFLLDADIMVFLRKFMDEYESNLSGCGAILDGVGGVITHELIRGLLKVEAPAISPSDRFDIERVVEHMQQHFGEKNTVAGLARLANMSAPHLLRLFSREKGVSPMEYLIRLRIDKARKLLRNPANTITEVSLQCGFNSTSHFSTCFAKRFGITPRQYRDMFAKRRK